MNVFLTGRSGRLGSVLAAAFEARGDTLVPEGEDVNYMIFAHRYRGPPDHDLEMHANIEKIRLWINSAIWAAGDKAIVLVTSISAYQPAMNQSLAYNLSKAAQEQMVRWYSKALPVRVNAVAPNTFTGPRPVITAHEIASVILFLANPKASGINGQSLKVG